MRYPYRMSDVSIEPLWQSARAVREHAYAPYSGYAVGAAARMAGSTRIFTGCNVENASFGATICAERNAIWAAVAELGGRPRLEAMVLVTRSPAPPCGLCLQVMAEFGSPDTRLTLATPVEVLDTRALSDFLPIPFSPESLKSHD